MDISEQLKEPTGAAIFAGIVTALYIYFKAQLNDEPVPQTSAYTKPAILVAILVYYIVSTGVSAKETISTDPF